MEIIIGIVAVAIVVAVIAIIWIGTRQRRTHRLQERFGAEYDETVGQADSRRRAEAELEARQKRVDTLHIVEVTPEEATQFADEWQGVQARFVDRPSEAIIEAEALVTRVMGRRGYPMADFDQRAADLSVDHPEVVSEYRQARAIAVANANGDASTEDLRQAMLHYRALFSELLGERAHR